MNKELAKTLTTALVQFIDRERPEGTMCCSNTDCENIRAAFEEGEYDCVEAFIQKKLSRLTEFELHLLDWLSSDTSGEIPMERMKEVVKNRAAELLAIAKKELLKDDELTKKHLEGYCMGREDTLRDMMNYVESLFHGKKTKEFDTPTINIPAWEPPCYHGGPCTNPMRDCINCPGKTTGLGFSTSTGTSTAVLQGNTSTTDGEPHNPSFTD